VQFGRGGNGQAQSDAVAADADGAGIDMTIACLAVLAGLLLLLPGRKGQAATVGLKRPATIGHPPSPARAGPRTRSLAELYISLT